ncbi:MAG: SUMF1/EgtB/PvdO family nonheme iron enzyme [Candidatus Acidiferrales bacterium]
MGSSVATARNPSQQRPPREALLLQRLAEARARTDELFGIVRPEALYDRPIAERHRIIFYVGHVEAFDWNLLGRGHFELPAFDAGFDQLFAFGIDPVGGGLPTDAPEDWPEREQVDAYNQRLRSALDERLATALDPGAARAGETARLVNVAIEHRLMHAETLAYMLHRLAPERKFSRVDAPTPAAAQLTPRMVRIPAGAATLGLRRDDREAFGWDNEFEEHRVDVPEFRIDARKVTNGEFLKFVSSGGYQERSFWEDADWEWMQSTGTSRPAFWELRDGRIFLRTMFDEIPLPLDWPVYASHAEARAYARWAGKELPSEAEWHRAAYGTPNGTERAFPWGDETPAADRGNFDFARWDPTPVGSFPAGASAFGVEDMLGNGWEWTRTIFAPFPGFEPFTFYPGYSANFFDGQHYVMKGASARTAACLLRRSFRNWFQPHYPFVYAGFRCVAHESRANPNSR